MPARGQNFYFQDPTLLSDTVNSRAEESYPIFSEKDSTLYYVRTLYSANVGGMRGGQDIWYTKKLPDGSWSIPKNDLDKLNNRNNNAVVGVTAAGNTLYLLNSYENEVPNQPGVASSSDQSDGWLAPVDMNIPELEDNTGNHYGVFVAPSEDVAIISMEREGAVGQEDLYVVFRDSLSREWSRPLHLGDTINTEGYEMSPFLSEDQQHLFFASNGHPGYGNADIFVATRQDSSWTQWSKPKNLGDGINSASFDAYLTTTPSNQVFFVSNRYGRSTDIYQSKLISQEERNQQLAKRIEARQQRALDSLQEGGGLGTTDAETAALLAETEALLNEFRGINQGTSPADGTDATSAEEEATFLFFALNSSELQNSAVPYLREVATQLQADPALNVELVGHADDTGGKDYNLKLSIERAQAAKQFLIDQGIDEERVISYGRGSTQPMAEGEDPEARRKNRRVEIMLDQ